MIEYSESLDWDPVDMVRDRLSHNQNALIVFTGQTGSGKSISALEFARLIDPTFNVTRVVFTTVEFLNLVEIISPGQVIIFDEAGIDLDSRRSMSSQNVFFSNIMKVFRYRQIPVIFTLPNLAMLDKNVRRVFHIWCKTREIDYERKICWTSLYRISAEDDWNDVITRSLPRIQNPITKEKRKITRVGFRQAPPDLVAAYEAKKHIYVTGMFSEMRTSLEKSKRAKKGLVKAEIPPPPISLLPSTSKRVITPSEVTAALKSVEKKPRKTRDTLK